jgi:hypothetical protein
MGCQLMLVETFGQVDLAGFGFSHLLANYWAVSTQGKEPATAALVKTEELSSLRQTVTCVESSPRQKEPANHEIQIHSS